MFERLSRHARTLLTSARQAAQEFGHGYIGTEHILLGVVAADGTVASIALRNLRVDVARIRAEVSRIVHRGTDHPRGQLPFTPRGKRVLELSAEEAQEAGHSYVGTGHILLGLLREDKGLAGQVLHRLGLTVEKLRPAVQDAIRTSTDPGDGPPTRSAEASQPLRDLLAEASVEAARRGRAVVEPEDALVAMLLGDSVAARILRDLGATLDGVRKRIEEMRRT